MRKGKIEKKIGLLVAAALLWVQPVQGSSFEESAFSGEAAHIEEQAEEEQTEEQTQEEPQFQAEAFEEILEGEPTEAPPMPEENWGYDSYAEPVMDMGEAPEEEEEVLHQPKLLLESSTLGTEPLDAGENREITVTLRNKSPDRSILNLKVTVGSPEGKLQLSKSSFYEAAVGPGETVALSLGLLAGPAAEPGSASLELQLEYEDDKGTACTGTEKLSLSVRQPVQASMTGVVLPAQVTSTDTKKQSIQVQNTGKALIRNAKVTLQAPGLFSTKEVFLGNLEPGSAQEGELIYYVGTRDMEKLGTAGGGTEEEKYGETTGTLLLTYEDDLGKTYTQEQEVATVILKPKFMELKVEEPEEESNQWRLSLVVLGAAFGLAVIVILLIQVRSTRRKLADAMIIREEMHEKSQ